MLLRDVLVERLTRKGLEPALIRGFMKIMSQAIVGLTHVTRKEVNERLHFLGWDDFDLDDHTLQLILANLDSGGPLDTWGDPNPGPGINKQEDSLRRI